MTGVPGPVVAGVAAVALAVAIAVLLVVGPRTPRIPLTRLDPSARPRPSALAGAVHDATALADRLLRRTGRSAALEEVLERAGIRARPGRLVVTTAGAALAAALLGWVLGGPLLALLLLLLAPAGTAAVVVVRRTRRQAAFADQLDDALQLMASSLRAGHSVLRAVDAVSRDAEAPAAEEFARVVNETRVGRDVTAALEDVAVRTASPDFAWVVQAIAIHREVGGNLAEVLDRVTATIRERTQLRRQARALSAEGRLSGIVLMAMPFVVFGALVFVAPDYASTLTGTSTGRVLLGIAGALLVVGGLWLRSTVRIRF